MNQGSEDGRNPALPVPEAVVAGEAGVLALLAATVLGLISRRGTAGQR